MNDMVRRAVVYINEQEIAMLLKLPSGIRVVGVSGDFVRMSIAVMVEGDEVEESPVGAVLPELWDGEFSPRFKEWIDGYHKGLNARVVPEVEDFR